LGTEKEKRRRERKRKRKEEGRTTSVVLPEGMTPPWRGESGKRSPMVLPARSVAAARPASVWLRTWEWEKARGQR
jgi:hypothetical protein